MHTYTHICMSINLYYINCLWLLANEVKCFALTAYYMNNVIYCCCFCCDVVMFRIKRPKKVKKLFHRKTCRVCIWQQPAADKLIGKCYNFLAGGEVRLSYE